MQINLNENKDIVVVPAEYKDLENPPTFIFKYPTNSDLLLFKYLEKNYAEEVVYTLFKDFKNPIEIFKNGQKVEYTTLKDLAEMAFNQQIKKILDECINVVFNKLFEIKKEGEEVEKKSE